MQACASTPAYISHGIPVFQPTMDEFMDFEKYVTSIERHGAESGIVKVIPPGQWHAQMPNYASYLAPSSSSAKEDKELLDSVVIAKPIQQLFTGQNGIYHQMNIESRKKYSILEFMRLADSLRPPPMKENFRSTRSKVVPSSGEDARNESWPTNTNWEELERLYWKILTFKEAYYGADLPGSLFPESIKHWNISKLPGLLSNLKKKIPGVNTPYLYFGSWKSTFSWHVEDMDLFSINYLHFGAPKHWYSIPISEKHRFERLAQDYFSSDYQNCPQFLRHKTTVISPNVLKNEKIVYNKMVQFPGEFIITFPYGYHQGFNYGFNCAEAVNFALNSWISKGLKAEYCHCLSDNVKIDVLGFIPQYFVNNDPEVREFIKKKKSSACSFSDTDTEECPRKKASSTSSKKKQETVIPKIKIIIRRHCYLCPNMFGNCLATSVKGRYVHALCASMLPELKMDDNDVFVGLESLPSDYFKKNCMLCGNIEGVFIKCADMECFKHYHLSCAQSHSLCYRDSKLIFCAVHDPSKYLIKRRSKLYRMLESVRKLKPGDPVVVSKDYRKTGMEREGTVVEISLVKNACLISLECLGMDRVVKKTNAWIAFKFIQLLGESEATKPPPPPFPDASQFKLPGNDVSELLFSTPSQAPLDKNETCREDSAPCES